MKRVKSEVECAFCGKKFQQTRWWQVFCSRECKKTVEKTAKSRVKELEDENRFLRQRVKELETNELAHSLRSQGVMTQPKGFKYDDENQGLRY